MYSVGKAMGKQAYFGDSTVKIGTNSINNLCNSYYWTNIGL